MTSAIGETMNIFVINCGSSSLGFKVYQSDSMRVLLSGKARNVATKTRALPEIDWTYNGKAGMKETPLPSHARAAREILAILAKNELKIDAIGHRFVHGGDLFHQTARVDEESLARLRQCLPLAPIHNPNSLSVIEVFLQEMPTTPQFAVFDTAFHAHMPVEARRYALPAAVTEKFGLYKYGFHGLSYQYVSSRAVQLLNRPLDQVKLIICHLGTGGSSVAAFQGGRSIETSMGYSPISGLVMSTRCGDIDAEVVLELIRQGFSAEDVDNMLNTRSGLIGLSGYSSNLAEVIEAAEGGNENCRIAYEVYANRLKFYLGAYTWQLGGADAIMFTDDIGTGSWKLREKVCAGVENLGVLLDMEKNKAANPRQMSFIEREDSPTRIIVIPTDEESVILEEVLKHLSD